MLTIGHCLVSAAVAPMFCTSRYIESLASIDCEVISFFNFPHHIKNIFSLIATIVDGGKC